MWCDCHVHIVGPIGQNPQIPERTYQAGPAPLNTLLALGKPCGIDRFVIVQPSFYGVDNTVLLQTLRDLGGNGRGVAVIDTASASNQQLDNLHLQGVRGLRVNLYSPLSGRTQEPLNLVFDAVTSVARRRAWHVEVIAPLAHLLASADYLRNSPVPVVIDHYGLYERTRPTDPDGKSLLELVSMPHVWMKLSAPYRHDKGALNIHPEGEWLNALLSAAPLRCVWGSDWPHPPPHDTHRGAEIETSYRQIGYRTLVDCFVDAVGSTSIVDGIFGANAARLYDF